MAKRKPNYLQLSFDTGRNRTLTTISYPNFEKCYNEINQLLSRIENSPLFDDETKEFFHTIKLMAAVIRRNP